MKTANTYYSIVFDKEERRQLVGNVGIWGLIQMSMPRRRAAYIKAVVLKAPELVSENYHLKKKLEALSQQAKELKTEEPAQATSCVLGQSGTTWTGYFLGIKKAGNVIYPVWG